jgi:hypothetical protein
MSLELERWLVRCLRDESRSTRHLLAPYLPYDLCFDVCDYLYAFAFVAGAKAERPVPMLRAGDVVVLHVGLAVAPLVVQFEWNSDPWTRRHAAVAEHALGEADVWQFTEDELMRVCVEPLGLAIS